MVFYSTVKVNLTKRNDTWLFVSATQDLGELADV